MASAGNVEDLKIKVGLKYTDPKKEYEFLDKLGEGCVLLPIHLISLNDLRSKASCGTKLTLHGADFLELNSDLISSRSLAPPLAPMDLFSTPNISLHILFMLSSKSLLKTTCKTSSGFVASPPPISPILGFSLHLMALEHAHHSLLWSLTRIFSKFACESQETEHMMECKCENIVGYDACFLLNEQLWIVMELCAGGSLNDLMKLAHATLNEEQIATCMRDILKALAYLHDNNRIHRDIKAGNVLLTSDGVAKLADFGVSGTLSKDTAQRHTVIGTPFWMAPEVIQETGHNYKVDIWSLGITMIELAEGHPPLCNLHPLRAIFVIPSRPPPTFTDKTAWPEDMNDFLAQCLTKDANQRPTAKQLLTHPWILRHQAIDGTVLKPLIEISDNAIKAAGGRDAALNALYDDSDGSESEESSAASSGSGTDSGSGAGQNSSAYSTMQIKSDDNNEYGSGSDDEYSTMKVNKSPAAKKPTPAKSTSEKKSKKKKSKRPARESSSDEEDNEEQDYGTMIVVKSDSPAKSSKKDKKDLDSSGSVEEDLGTIQIKKKKKKSSKKNDENGTMVKVGSSRSNKGDSEQPSTIVVKREISTKMRDDRLGTLARGESPKVRAVRQELEELDVAMVAKLQTLSKQVGKDREMIAAILAARKA